MAYVKVKQIKATLGKAIRYVANPSKTENTVLVYSNAGTGARDITAAMMKTRDEARAEHRRGRRPTVMAHHLIQSFKPGEVSSRDAHEIGLKYAKRLFGDDYQFVVATHVDRDHIHNHVIVNACSRTSLRQMRIQRDTLSQWRGLSDELARAYGLSVITPRDQQRERIDIAALNATAQGRHPHDRIRLAIDKAITTTRTYSDFLHALSGQGVKVKQDSSQLVLTAANMRRPVRAARLGAAYSEEAIRSRIGRACVEEFVVSSRRVTVDGDQVKIRLPRQRGETKDTYLSVNADAVRQFVGYTKFYIPRNATQVWLKDDGSFYHTATFEQLCERLRGHRRSYQPALAFVPLPRGTSEGQRAFFARIDGAAAYSKIDLAMTDQRLAMAGASREDLLDERSRLEKMIWQANEELIEFILDQQCEDDINPDRDKTLEQMRYRSLVENCRLLQARLDAVDKLLPTIRPHRHATSRATPPSVPAAPSEPQLPLSRRGKHAAFTDPRYSPRPALDDNQSAPSPREGAPAAPVPPRRRRRHRR